MKPKLILTPRGRIIRRLTIEVDVNGQAEVKGENLDIPNQIQPMHTVEISLVLSQILATNIVQIAADYARRNGLGLNATEEKENNNRPI